MTDSPMSAFAFLAGFAVLGLVYRWYASHSERGQATARRLYSSKSQFIWIRNGIALVPLWAPASLLLGGVALLPRTLGAWLSVPVITLAAVSFALSYRVPAPFLPSWLRDEIDRGTTPVARPTGGDWLVFWVVAPIGVLGIVSIVALVLVFHKAG